MSAAETTLDPLLAWRSEFPILAHKTYLVNHSLGAMPRGVKESLLAFAERWECDGIEAWETWFPLIQATGDMLGRLMNAPAGSVMMHQNVSTLQSILASCFDFSGSKNGVVYEAMNFTTVHYLWQEQQRIGAKVRLVESPDGIHVPTEKVLDAIDDTTLVVPISHVLFQSNYVQDAKAIIEKAHHHGAHVVLDTYQSLGIVPLDVQALGVDFVVGGSVKWLCGGPGAAYLYVRPDLVPHFAPRQTGWLSHKAPFAFRMDMEYADDVLRFLGGSPGVASLYSAREGYRIIAEVGVEAIRAKSLRQTRKLMALAQAANLQIKNPQNDQMRGGTVCIDFPGSQAVSQALLRHNFQIDHRPACGIRVSPHFYNTDEEVERFVAAVVSLRDELRDA
ncbi:MAG: aminotransferase class V-fold PLP-dependent enzyme [Candidatus Sericytochromatia bacterium]|nr:aminotransferase class V-fold PLP-dependent enzyme [Candidatus Sericytochromatia bacterium]